MKTKVWYIHPRYSRTHYAVTVTKGRRPNIEAIMASKRAVGTGRNKDSALASLAHSLKGTVDNFEVISL